MDYQSFINVVAERFSCRKFLPQIPEDEEVLKIFEAVRLAPSACNKQPWRFVIVSRDKDPELHSAVAASYGREWAAEAPLLIVACGNHNESWHRQEDGKDALDIDVAIAVEHLCLAAASLGLATCWVCNFHPELLRKALNCSDEIEPVAIIPLGYPDPESVPAVRKRKNLDEIVIRGSF